MIAAKTLLKIILKKELHLDIGDETNFNNFVVDKVRKVVDSIDCGLYICCYLLKFFSCSDEGLREIKVQFSDKE